MVHERAGRRDVTVIISAEGLDERLMVAVDGTRALLGLERSDGLLQLASTASDYEETPSPFTIGGQESVIQSRHLVDLTIAADVVAEWLEGGEASSQGNWERQ